MAMKCPHCKAPLSTERHIFGSYLWAKWECERCGSKLGYDKLHRLVVGLNLGLILILTGFFLLWSPLACFMVVLLAAFVPLMSVAWCCLGRVVVLQRRGVYCHSCGYDLTGNEHGRCPECGSYVTNG